MASIHAQKNRVGITCRVLWRQDGLQRTHIGNLTGVQPATPASSRSYVARDIGPFFGSVPVSPAPAADKPNRRYLVCSTSLSNARSEATNTHPRALTKRSYGFPLLRIP